MIFSLKDRIEIYEFFRLATIKLFIDCSKFRLISTAKKIKEIKNELGRYTVVTDNLIYVCRDKLNKIHFYKSMLEYLNNKKG